MIDLPDFQPLKVTHNARPPTRQVLDTLDHVAIVLPKKPRPEHFRALPQGAQLSKLLKRAGVHGLERVSSRVSNQRATGLTLATVPEGSAFEQLTWARHLIGHCMQDSPARLGLFVSGLEEEARRSALMKLVSAACATTFELPRFKTEKKGRPARLRTLTLLGLKTPLALDDTLAAAAGNNLARWFTALPPNELTAGSYRDAVRQLARRHGWQFEFLDERTLASLGAGTILREVLEAAKLLEEAFDVPADVWSVTSFSELRRDALAVERWNERHPAQKPRVGYVASCLGREKGPFIAATDYVKGVPDQIRQWVPGAYRVLGTDGFGRSDGRAALREFFEVDRHSIVVSALKALTDDGALDAETVGKALRKFGIDPDRPDPVTL